MAGNTKAGILNVIIGAKISDFLTKMQIVERQTGRTKDHALEAMKSMRFAFAGAFTAISAFAMRSSIEFGRAMTKMQTLAGVSAKEIDGFKKSILQLSTEVGRSPQELAEALYFITSSGLEGATALEALTASAKASAIGMGETQVVADALTSILNAYGHEAYSAEEATNILLKTIKLGKAEADELASSIGDVVPNAAQLGVSFEEISAAISATTLIGKSASEAITGINSVLMSTIKTSSEGAKRLDSVGLSYADLRNELSTNGLSGMIKMLNEKFGDNVEAIGEVLGRKEAINTYFTLTGKSAGNYAKALDEAAKKTRDLAEADKLYQDTAAGRKEKLIARVEGSYIKYGDVLTSIALKTQDLAIADREAAKAIHNKYLRTLQYNREAKKALTGPNVTGNPFAPSGMGLLGYGQGQSSTTSPATDPDPKPDPEDLGDRFGVLAARVGLAERALAEYRKEKEKLAEKTQDLQIKIGKSEEAILEQARAARQAEMANRDFGQTFADAMERAGYSAQEFAQNTLDTFGFLFDFMAGIAQRLDRIYSISHQNRMLDLEAREEAERASLEARYGDEENYADLVANLNDQQAARRKRAQKEYAEQQKRLATFQAIILGAQATLQALASGPPPWNFVMAGVTAGLSGLEVAAINGASIPAFASGGVMPQSGMAMVGEFGPEMVHLPGGARVSPNRAMSSGMLQAEFDREKQVVWLSQGNRHHSMRRAGV